ncbi:MAG: cyclic nucleotide-binding protein [Solirubrobacterales bacterium]|nr:cyclic nucleotide-binding protein [Solirubrobacterales bacterium]
MTSPRSRAQQGSFVFLAHGSERDWRLLVGATVRERVPAGELLVEEGGTDRDLFLLVGGRLEVLGGEREAHALHEVEAPTVVGELAFLDGLPRSVTLRAATDVDVLRLTPAAFDALAAAEPALGRAVLFELGRMVSARLRTATAVLVEHLDG